jgi:hypothetical protein
MERELTVVAARTEFHIEKIELARSAQSFVVRPWVRAPARERALGRNTAAPANFPGPLNDTRFRWAFGRPIAGLGPVPGPCAQELA